MTTTTIFNLPLMQSSEAPDLPQNNSQVASIVEGILSNRIQHGKVTVTGTGSNQATIAVTFPTAFVNFPIVFVSYTDSGATNYFASVVGTVSKTGFTAAINRSQNGSYTFSSARDLFWIALDF